MEIRTLENKTVSELTTVFNKAFEKYFVPLKLSEEQLQQKMQGRWDGPESFRWRIRG